MHKPEEPRPGLAKVRSPPLVGTSVRRLARLEPGPLAEMFEQADVVSEGSSRVEATGKVYYGTTSLLFTVRSEGGPVPDARCEAIAALLAFDPHARLRSLRLARREAELRAGAPVGTMSAEITVARAPRGIAIAIDVVASLASAPKARRRATAPHVKRGV